MITPARTTDPATSHKSAQRVPMQLLEFQIRRVLQVAGDNGLICSEICDATGLNWNTVSPRIRPMLRKGWIAETGQTRRGPSGRQQRVVRAV